MCGPYDRSHPKATLLGYGGAAVRGYTFAGSSHVRVTNSEVRDLKAKAGTAIGFDILTDSRKVKISNSEVQDVNAGWGYVPNPGSPNKSPRAMAFHIGPATAKVRINKACGYALQAYGTPFLQYRNMGFP